MVMAKISRSLLNSLVHQKSLARSFQARCITTDLLPIAGFDQMLSGVQRKYYMLGGKGGVGKTSCAQGRIQKFFSGFLGGLKPRASALGCAASLAVKFANSGHSTIVVSTDPAHSLSDSFDQDLTGGTLVPVQGVDSPLYALEINPERSREEFRAARKQIDEGGVKNTMDSMGLGKLGEQLGDLKLGELLDTPLPGLDEAIAISKVMQFVESQEYSQFSRIVFDTAPTVHTLWLLSLPDFLDASLGKMMKVKKKIASTTAALKSAFGKGEPQQDNNDMLEQLRERMGKVRDLFRNQETTEFVIVTIPTVMAISESSRLCSSLRKECVPVQRLIVNQVLPPSASDCKFCSMRRKDQTRAMETIRKDAELSKLSLIESPLMDVEIRGVPALKFMGDMVWR